MKTIKTVVSALLSCGMFAVAGAQDLAGLSTELLLKKPGNPAVSYKLSPNGNSASGNAVEWTMSGNRELPVVLKQDVSTQGDITTVTLTVTAKEMVYYNLGCTYVMNGSAHDDCLFYMPGFWYHKNLRSPKEAPSFHTSDSWVVREDRLSTPLTGIFNAKSGEAYTVLRREDASADCVLQNLSGDVILTGETSLGYTGFRNVDGKSALEFGYPYREAPRRYIRKLTLIDPVRTFAKLDKGDSKSVTWQIRHGKYADYSAFIADVWKYSFDAMNPQLVASAYTDDQAKEIMTNYFKESYVDKYPLKFLSSPTMPVASCDSRPAAEIGFVGRTLLNAFNAIEYGEANNRPDLVEIGKNIFDSYLANGFSKNGFFREYIDFGSNYETKDYSIRRQSEGIMAVLFYLQYEKSKGRKHPEWEAKMETLFDNFTKLQKEDGSFPRKFNDDFKDVDPSGGSTPCATLALSMGYKYFKDKDCLEEAKRTIDYLDKSIISTSDYFSSTLDANCEDKEASFYACDALYFLSFVTKGKERERYVELCKKAAYFCASWYYTWDVPFTQGQMLGDLDFKSRGWGNVSVENNHIDVYIFEFAEIMKWLSAETDEPRFAKMADVIKSSMLQLMPVKDNLCGMGKVGYYPEVVQHTAWDYGRNGKGFYNDIFAPGWTVASLWSLLTPDRVTGFFSAKK